MKIMREFLVVLGVLTLFPGFTVQAQTSPPKHADRTIWVDPRTGSLLGGGYTRTYLTNIRAKTIAAEDPALRNAIDSLDALGMYSVNGFGLVPVAVAWKAQTPLETLIEEQAETGLSYGELLMANSLAVEAKVSFARIVAMRAETRTWGKLMKQLGADPGIIIARAKAAVDSILQADARYYRKKIWNTRNWGLGLPQ